MASILDRYGIKEVADFTFYTINDSTGKPEAPALYLDTLKVSTLEQTADLVEAKGGKGNVTLLSWDINKALTVTLEDALFSAKSLAIMFGNGSLKSYTGNNAYIMRTEVFKATATSSVTTTIVAAAKAAGWNDKYEGPNGYKYDKVNPKFYTETGALVTTGFTADVSYFCSYDIVVSGSVIDVSANSFPGTYYCVGDTYVRNAISGKDEFFQIIIPKAKVQSGSTLTMQAEGDPSTFSMNLKVMKPDDGVMIKLVKYDAVNGTAPSAESSTATIDHNHVLSNCASVTMTGSDTEEVTLTGVTSTTSVEVIPTYTGLTATAGSGKVTLATSSAAAGIAQVYVADKGIITVTITAAE